MRLILCPRQLDGKDRWVYTSEMSIKITAHTLPKALAELGDRDPDMAISHALAGDPPLRRRPAGFAALLRIIIAQQVSTASARAILGRLDEAACPLTPETFLALDDDALRAQSGSAVRRRVTGAGLPWTWWRGAWSLTG